MTKRFAIAITSMIVAAAPAMACDCTTYPFKPDGCETKCMAKALGRTARGSDGESGMIKLGIEPGKAAELRGKSDKQIEEVLKTDPSIETAIGRTLERDFERARSLGIERFGAGKED